MKESENPPGIADDVEQQTARKVALVTDSIAQVPVEADRELDIQVVPYSVVVEGEIIQDLSDYNLGRLYRRMRTEKNLQLSTSAPSVGVFYETFISVLQNGAESIVYVGLASRLSHAFANAVEAARMIQEKTGRQPIALVDTRMGTAAQGFLVIEAAKLAKRGANPQEIVQHVTNERTRVGLAAGLETLEYIARGGRIGKAAYMLGSVIRILPVLTLDDKGEVIPISKKFGYSRVLEDCLRYVREKVYGCR